MGISLCQRLKVSTKLSKILLWLQQQLISIISLLDWIYKCHLALAPQVVAPGFYQISRDQVNYLYSSPREGPGALWDWGCPSAPLTALLWKAVKLFREDMMVCTELSVCRCRVGDHCTYFPHFCTLLMPRAGGDTKTRALKQGHFRWWAMAKRCSILFSLVIQWACALESCQAGAV